MNKSTLFTQAHKMTKLTIKPEETYRYKFGQWLIFLKTGISNKLGITNINQSVCYVPILKHDKNGSLFHELFHLLLKITKSNIEFVVNLLYDFWRLDLYFAV